MKKTLLVACLAVLGLFGLVLLAALLFLSPDWEVTRSRTVKAQVSTIHASIADLHGWPEWTSWGRDAGKDAKWSFEGAPAGSGAVMRWEAERFGKGRLIILKAGASGIEYEMVLEHEGERTIAGTVSYTPVDGGTQVDWTDRGVFGANPVLRLFKRPFVASYGTGLESCLDGLAERVEGQRR